MILGRAKNLTSATDAQQLGFRGIAIDMSSSHPKGTIILAEQLGRKSIRLIDAPVSGGQKKLPGVLSSSLSPTPQPHRLERGMAVR